MATYIVKPGDSLGAIAKRVGVASWRELYNHPRNAEFKRKRPNPNVIHPGDKLYVPGDDGTDSPGADGTPEVIDLEETEIVGDSASPDKTKVRLLTLVTNYQGMGPGHSAVAVNDLVYTFEDALNVIGSGSAWRRIYYRTYLKQNAHRPILVQALFRANPDKVESYIDSSRTRDDDYLSAGVCSQQVAQAVNAGLPHITFDPRGFDTPLGVYRCARRLGLVFEEKYFWSGRDTIPRSDWEKIVSRIRDDYPLAYKRMDYSRY